MLSLVLFGLALAPAGARAQIKLPVFEDDGGPIKNVVYQEAKGGDLQHGKLLNVTLKGDQTVKGTLVRVDRNAKVIYLRTEPGAKPRAIKQDDITKVDKGVIKQASFSQDARAPEIRPLIIINGGKKTVSYDAPSLSPGEQAQLRELEAAENEYARIESQVNFQNQVLENDIALQAGQVRAQELMNELLQKREIPGGYANSVAATPFYSNYGYNFIPTIGNGFEYASKFIPASYQTTPLPMVRAGTVFPNLTVPPEALSKARQSLATAQNRAVFENGRLVAFIAD
jgi:hypothetical protein